MGIFTNLRNKFYRQKKQQLKNGYSLNEDKILTINSVIQDINIRIIRTFRQKVSALIQRRDITMKDGYLLRKAHAFNSFGIFYHLDLIFCSKNFKVIKTIENFGPQKVSHYYPQCYFIYCLAPGMIKFLDINLNDIIRIL